MEAIQRHWGMSYKLGRNSFDTYTIKGGCDLYVNIEWKIWGFEK